jgi:hypothetical protein
LFEGVLNVLDECPLKKSHSPQKIPGPLWVFAETGQIAPCLVRSARRGGVPGKGGARQSTVACNVNLSQCSQLYVLASRPRDQGSLCAGWRSTAIGLRQNC